MAPAFAHLTGEAIPDFAASGFKDQMTGVSSPGEEQPPDFRLQFLLPKGPLFDTVKIVALVVICADTSRFTDGLRSPIGYEPVRLPALAINNDSATGRRIVLKRQCYRFNNTDPNISRLLKVQIPETAFAIPVASHCATRT